MATQIWSLYDSQSGALGPDVSESITPELESFGAFEVRLLKGGFRVRKNNLNLIKKNLWKTSTYSHLKLYSFRNFRDASFSILVHLQCFES